MPHRSSRYGRWFKRASASGRISVLVKPDAIATSSNDRGPKAVGVAPSLQRKRNVSADNNQENGPGASTFQACVATTPEQAAINKYCHSDVIGASISTIACRPRHRGPVNNTQSIVPIGVKLPQPWFIALWVAITATHTACGLYLIAAANVNFFLQSTKGVYLAGLPTAKLAQYFSLAGIACGFLAALHFGHAAFILLVSLNQEQFVFRGKPQSTCSRTESKWIQKLRAAGACAEQMTRRTCKRFLGRGLVGEVSFAQVFTLQEVVVVLSQSYQAYRSSNLVSQSWINALYVAIVVANCWSIPVLCFLVRNHSRAKVRLVLLSADVLLNISLSFVFPFVIIWPYFRAFDMETQSFPQAYRYNAVWTSHATMETTMVMALSAVDLVSKLVNHLSILSSMLNITSLLSQRPRSITLQVRAAKSNITTNKPAFRHHKQSRLERCFHLLLVVWAIALLVVNRSATNRTKSPLLGCQSRTYPWFSSRGYPCTVFEFNCYQQQVESPASSSLALMDPDILLYLYFSHCPALRVPLTVQHFPLIRGFTVYNCTIADWSSASAISATKHTSLTAVVVARSNMSSFPDGLLQPLPATVAVVAFSYTNLTTLPPDLHKRWPSVSAFVVSNSQLQELPASIFQLRALAFFFSDNLIRELPPLDSVQKEIYLLDLSANPIQELPTSINPATSIGLFNVDYSNISIIPQWTSTNLGLGSAVGSPYCSIPAANRNSSNVVCTPMPHTAIGKLDINALDAVFPLVEKKS